jgi:central kinetochore subunit Mal2/MCM21
MRGDSEDVRKGERRRGASAEWCTVLWQKPSGCGKLGINEKVRSSDQRATGEIERTCYDLADLLYCGHQYAALKPRSQVDCTWMEPCPLWRAAAAKPCADPRHPCLARVYATAELHAQSNIDILDQHLPQVFNTSVMATVEDLDADITDLHARIATLHAHRSNLTSILLSQPHLSARLQTPNQSSDTVQRAIKQQSNRNLENIHRACAGVTAYKVQDPDPNAINNGNVLGVSIDVAIGGRFIETYHVLLNWRTRDASRLLMIHKHTIPPCIPLQQLANKWLPTGGKDVEVDPEQDLVRFGRLLRKELVSWHMRVKALEDLRKEAGLPSQKAREEKDGGVGDAGKVLNAFVSDDEESSDAEEDEGADGPIRVLDIEADAAVRQITITWSDRRIAVMSVTKDGRIEKAVCRAKDGSRDGAMSRKAIGPIGGLIRRLKA